ncbi:hypothetical protein GW750_05425 [bacterium]|nr:hypothetical protein [bacterium]
MIACYSIFFLGSYAIASVCPFSFSDVDPLASISFEALDTLQHQYKATSQK